MKLDMKRKVFTEIGKVGFQDILKPLLGIDIQVVFPSHKGEGRNEAEQPEYVIAVQVADEDIVDFCQPDLEPAKLNLCALSAIYQKKPLIYIK